MLGERLDDATPVVGAPQRARPPQAGAAQARLAGRGPRRLRRRRGAPDRPRRGRTGRCAPTSRRPPTAFWHGGSGVVVLPCGAGKTLVGAAAMAHAQATTLILVTNTVAARQWKAELLARTTPDRGRDRRVLRRAQGDPPGHHRDVPGADDCKRKGVYPHLELLDARDWGLIVYDEVHLLPAPVFRMTADLQARRRLGLTATLVREDGREGDVFSLIGPKRYDAPWKDIEAQGCIAPADCVEVRVDPARRRAAGLRDRRARGALPAGQLHPRQDAGRRAAGRAARGRAHAGHRPVPRPARRARRAPRRPGDQGRDDRSRSASGSSRRSAPARSTCWSSPRSRTSPSTCPRPPSRSRSPAPSARARRRPSGSAGCCGPRPTAGPPTSTRSSAATRSTRTSPQHRQRFLAEQGYAYRIVDADDL